MARRGAGGEAHLGVLLEFREHSHGRLVGGEGGHDVELLELDVDGVVVLAEEYPRLRRQHLRAAHERDCACAGELLLLSS